MLFLRPHMIRDESGSRGLTIDRYNYIKGQQLKSRPAPHPVLPTMQGPVLDGLHMGQPGSTQPPATPAVPPKPQ
jgi:general secretion pathway protein D